jgi:EAL domain-containing protein (putative c-di-GMP-specific phosphodiesterase class I)
MVACPPAATASCRFISPRNDSRDLCGEAALVELIIGMAHSLGLSIVAEGVESEVQFPYL